MKKNKKETYGLVILVIIACLIMAFVEIIIEPNYAIKSLIKIVAFLFLPILCMKLLQIKIAESSFLLNKKNVIKLMGLGFFIYFIIFGAYLVTKNVFDYSLLVNSLAADQNVDSRFFIFVALYISFCNSFLEEFLFRYISFIKLSKYTSKLFASGFSSMMFALYHVSMIGSSFPFILLILATIGLMIGGWIFNYVDSKNENIYNSWIIHMFADFALMTIWYIYL